MKDISFQNAESENPLPYVGYQHNEENHTNDEEQSPHGEQHKKCNYIDANHRKKVSKQLEGCTISEREKSNAILSRQRMINPDKEEQHPGRRETNQGNYSHNNRNEKNEINILQDEEGILNDIKEKEGDNLMGASYPHPYPYPYPHPDGVEKSDELPKKDGECLSTPHLVKCERIYLSEGGNRMGGDTSVDASNLCRESINVVECDPCEQNTNQENSVKDASSQKLGGKSSDAETESGNSSTCCQSEEGEKVQKS
ncbi:hypothetical protein PCYB_052450, partial [Plasmodium cynomolgi strain B]